MEIESFAESQEKFIDALVKMQQFSTPFVLPTDHEIYAVEWGEEPTLPDGSPRPKMR